MNEIEELRKEIDSIDNEIVSLYEKRIDLSIKIGEIKRKNNIEVTDNSREHVIIERLTDNKPIIYKKAITNLYNNIFTESKKIQEEIPVKVEPKDRYALIGRKLSHSYSKDIHNGNGLDYSLVELEPERLEEFFKDFSYTGINVTIPYKQDVMKYLDVISSEAREIGSVNTIKKTDGKLYGYNTDVYGMEYMFSRKNINVSGKNVLILGSGGTSKTAIYFLKKHNAGTINVISRTGENNYENSYDKFPDTEIIINTTPVGMYPDTEDCPIEIERFSKLEFVADCIYNPIRTELILRAQKLGIKTTNGLPMLVYQALKSEEIWLGNNASKKADKILEKTFKSKINLVLLGMPGCGKTSIGTVLSKILYKKFVDTDALITKKAGMSPSELLNTKGEEELRRIETEVIKEVSFETNQVISLGGGSVLKEENVSYLRKNGICVWVKRSTDKLSLKNRPLSVEKGVKKLYQERKEKYRSASDFTADNNAGKGDCIKEIVFIYEDSCNKWC